MRKPMLYSFTGVIVIAVLLLGNAARGLPARSFPQVDGTLKLDGLDAPVDIYRDANGIPHIYASTTHDLFFAQGYIHAQDRFFQMDFWRHIGSGRLSEMFGESQLDTDKFLRALGWARVVQQELELIDPGSRAILESYAAGVNAYLADRDPLEVSLEYAVMKLTNRGYIIEPWTPLHSLTWAKAMAWDLRANMDEEGHRSVLLKTLTREQIDQLYPPYPDHQPVIVNQPHVTAPPREVGALAPAGHEDVLAALEAQSRYIDARAEALNNLLGPGGPGAGSNNWVISGRLTATGKPLLANDPHLGPQMPSIWYEIGLHCAPVSAECPVEVAGYSFASAPGVVIGHNNRIAWGFTNVGPDVQDVYIEKINPDNPDQYEVNGQWVDMTTVQETIQVAGGEPVEITVRYTRHGPLLWDDPEAMAEFRADSGLGLPQEYRLALRWTALEPGTTFPALWAMNRAQNWEEFRAAASLFDVPAQNFVYADVDGNIGYQMPGKIPLRAGGDGRMYVPGWVDTYEWTGYIPFENLPFAYNPPEGYIVTANNAVVRADYPYFITSDWDYGYRARRIVELIENAPGPIDAAYIQQMQGDSRNLSVDFLVPLLGPALQGDAKLEQAAALLDGWDGQQTIDSAPAALYNAYLRHLLLNTFADDLPEDLGPDGGSRWFAVLEGIAGDPASPWWDDRATPDVEDRDDIVVRSFAEGLAELEKLQGKDPAKWNWGSLHAITFKNKTFGESGIAPIEGLFNRGPFPVGGGQNVVNATGWTATAGYETDWLPSMRMIVDLADFTRSQAVNTTGQSGHAYHPHYVDLADLWRTVQYHPLRWSVQQTQEQSASHLRLEP